MASERGTCDKCQEESITAEGKLVIHHRLKGLKVFIRLCPLHDSAERIAELERQLEQATIAVDQASDTLFKKDALIANITKSLPTIDMYLATEKLEPSPCGVKGHCKVDWTERRNSERRINNHCCNGGTIHCLELHPSRVGCRRNFPRRITNLGGYCRRCKEINRACAEAELSEAERQGERIEKAVTEALEAAVVRFEFVALEYCERWKVMPKQFIDKGTVAIRGKAVKSG